jgi:pimeloyl-ACP methyl ester carboxylesterase
MAVVLYAIALAGSWLVTARLRQVPPLEPGEREVSLSTAGSRNPSQAAVRVVFRDEGSEDDVGSPVLMLHGSPGRSHDFATVSPTVARDRRAIAPNLPGFGKSSRDVPDYSIRAHAAYMLALLDRLGIDRAHLVGYSMGGGVALEMAAHAPGRVASIVLLASIGLQEFELTGRYWPNHAIHAAQLGALWMLHRAVPHFGLFDRTPLTVAYARNFFDSDQRPLRAALDGLAMPVLILHGTEDPLVPFEAAAEHHRRVPQSELQVIPHGHFAPFADGPAVGARIAAFLAEVDANRALTKATAGASRLAESRRPVDVPTRPRGFGLLVTVAALVTPLLAAGAACWWLRARLAARRGSSSDWPHPVA